MKFILFVRWFILYLAGLVTAFEALNVITKDMFIGSCMLVAGTISLLAAKNEKVSKCFTEK